MYESIKNNTPVSGEDMGASPARQTRRMAPPTPPSPRYDSDIPWGDRKPAAKPRFVYKRSPDTISDIDIDFVTPPTKDGILLQNESTKRRTKTAPKTNDATIPTKQGRKTANQRKNNEMSKRELCLVLTIFFCIVILTVTITVVLMNKNTLFGNDKKKTRNSMNSGDGLSTIVIPVNDPTSTETAQARTISVREEWELVQAAILGNSVTRPLLDDETLPKDLFFYDHLVSGMVFSEKQRDWVPAKFLDDDIAVSIQGMEGMSMEAYEEFGSSTTSSSTTTSSSSTTHRGSTKKTLTPNQKATAWLLFHDELKDPNESVWRWAMASIYFKMGGPNWSFYDSSNSKWLTSAPLCEWERIYGSSGCEKHRQQFLPVELDFDATNMAGPIAIEFALLLQPNVGYWFDKDSEASNLPTTTNTMVRSIMLSDNRLTGTIPGAAFQHLMPSLGKLYLDNNQLTGPIPIELGGLGKLIIARFGIFGFCFVGGFLNSIPFLMFATLFCMTLLYRHTLRTK